MKNLLLASALMILSSAEILSQGTSTFGSTTPVGLAAASPLGSYTLSNFEQYDPFSGRVNVTVPIYHVGGRGDLGFDLAYPLPQTWRIDNQPNFAWPPNPQIGQLSTFSYNQSYLAPQPWNIFGQSLSAGTMWFRQGASFQACGYNPAYGIPAMDPTYTITKLAFTAPDGTETELVDDLTNGQPLAWQNVCQTNIGPVGSLSRGVSFHSVTGGSQLEFVSDSPVSDSAFPGADFAASGYLYLPNGATYRFDSGLISWMRDRNGNEITFTYSSNSYHTLNGITDSLGRQIAIEYNNSSCVPCITVSYQGYNGASREVTLYFDEMGDALRSDYSIENYSKLFPSFNGTDGQFIPVVLTAVQYQDGREYTFKYNSYAEIARINLPTGGAVEYDYGDGNNGATSGYQSNSGGVGIIYRRLQERREYSNGSARSSRTHNSVSNPNSTTVETQVTYDGSGSTVAQVVHTMNGSPVDGLNMTGVACNAWNEGLETRTDYGTPSALKTVTNQYVPQSGCMDNPQLAGATVTLDDTNQVSQTTYQYDQYNNVVDVKRYDWGNGAPGALLNETKTAYVWTSDSTYSTPNSLPSAAYLPSLPASQTLLDGSGNQAAQTLWFYDQTAPQANAGMGGHDDTNFGTNFNHRGNLTSEQHWLNTNNGYATIARTFDVAGNVITQKDPDNNTTTFSYADPQNTYAHVTKTTNALNQSTVASYDFSTGKIVTATGLNGEQASYAYNDPRDRITVIQAPNGAKTSYSYPNYTTAVVQRDENTVGDGALKSQSLFDGFGRLSENDTYETSSQYIATTRTYDAMGRVASTTNPSRPGDSLGYATAYSYDSVGRVKSVVASDDVSTTNSYSGNVMTVTDPAGHAKSFTLNGLGELQSVAETVQSGSVVNTYYSYDVLGDLVCVSQSACPGSWVRSFTYDSLKRLTKAVNPESGTVTYAYDNVGNQLSRTDNRNYTTTYAYDALNRLQAVAYPSGSGSQNVSYTYDTGGSNSIGRLVSVSNGSTTNYTSFDSMGHVLSSNQVTIGTTYPFAYSYNLAGGLTSETYPSGRVVSTSYDGANRPSEVAGNLQGQSTTYLNQTWYWPHGEVGYYTLANNLVPAYAYNRHFQPTKIYAAISDSVNSFLFMECYNWGAPNSDSFFGSCPTWSGTNDNGNLYGSVTYAGGPGTQSSLTAYTDAFTYDGLNRLLSASDSGGWSRTFNYDQYGNLWVTNPTGPGLNSATPTQDVYNPKNQMTTATYDASGNQLSLGPYTLAYDAENHQVSESNTIGNPSASYSYDGAGRRVVRLVGAQTTVYVYDAFGALAAAYSNGGMGSPPCHTCYLTYDHLGTTRLITDSSAKVIARHDYLPFGEEIPGGIAGRSSSQFGPGLDNINHKFTGQERDSESGLDFFQARYFGGALGRFLSPDPKNAGALLITPQSWNAYAYVANNPFNATDASGMMRTPWGMSDGGGGGGGDFGSTWNEFDVMNIPIVTQVWTGPQTVMPPDAINVASSIQGSGITSVNISYSPLQTTPGTWNTVQIGTGADLLANAANYDVPVGIDIWQGQHKLWSNTAGVGNTAAAATAAVASLPAAAAAASAAVTGVAQGIGWAQGTFGAGTGVVLGAYNQINNYLESGESMGANYFNVGEYVWNILSSLGETWTANQAFLDASIARNQQFWLSTNPLEAEGSFAMELEYLTSKGIGPSQWQMVPLPLK